MADEQRSDRRIDRHKDPKRWKPTLRPNKPLYMQVARQVRLMPGKWSMTGHYEAFLRWAAHETDELPPRPPKPEPDDTED